LAIDSKFSLDNYNKIIYSENVIEKEKYELEFIKDLKIRINETSKYIKPEEGTMDFAFMFIPSE
jgi:DNA recombination protein RmuC